MKQFIYTLSHPITKDIVYIGKTKDIKKRHRDHCRRPNGKYKTFLDKWKKGLIDIGLMPHIDIIRECCNEDVDSFEKYYIFEYRKNHNLLNMTDGGDGLQNPSKETKRKIGEKSRGRKPSEETRKKISDNNYNRSSSKKILCYDKNGNFIKEYTNARRASEELGISHKNISSSLVKNSYTIGYTFFFKGEQNIEEKIKERILKKIKTGEIFMRIDKLGNIKEYNSIIEASRDISCNFRNLWMCLQNKRKKCGGFGWCYKNEYEGDFHKYFTKGKDSSKKIYSTLLDQTFDSLTEASKITNIHMSSICSYLKGNKIPKNGDKWIYVV